MDDGIQGEVSAGEGVDGARPTRGEPAQSPRIAVADPAWSHLAELAPELILSSDRIWTSDRGGPVCYPEAGNEGTFAVEETSFWFRHRSACILSLVRRLPPFDGPRGDGAGVRPILDVGAGNGAVTAALIAAGHATIALEPGAGARNAAARGLPAVIRARFEDLTFRPGAISAVGLFDVLEHIQDDVGFLAKVHAALAPGGRLYLTVPAGPWLWSVDDEYASHWRRYTQRALRRALTAARFRVEVASFFFTLLVVPIFLCRRLPTLAGRRRLEQASRVREHEALREPLASLVGRLLELELRWLDRGHVLPFGGSLIVGATAL